jgi:hypothetical protein
MLPRALVGDAEVGRKVGDGCATPMLDVQQDLAACFGESLNRFVHGSSLQGAWFRLELAPDGTGKSGGKNR